MGKKILSTILVFFMVASLSLDSGSAQASVKITKKNDSVYVTGTSYVRASYSTTAKKLGVIKTGNVLKRTGVINKGWTRITYKGKTAYVLSKYVRVIIITKKNDTVYAINGVNVRLSYSNSSKSLGSFKKGDSVKRTGVVNNGWTRIKYKGKNAYVSSSYVTTKKPIPIPTPKPGKKVSVKQFTKYDNVLSGTVKSIDDNGVAVKDALTYINKKRTKPLVWSTFCEKRAFQIARGEIDKEGGSREGEVLLRRTLSTSEACDYRFNVMELDKDTLKEFALVKINYTDNWNNKKTRWVFVVR